MAHRLQTKATGYLYMCQEPENKGDHSKVRIYTSPCMIQEHQETRKRLSEVWQKVSEQDDLIQELRNKLACSNALVRASLQNTVLTDSPRSHEKGSQLN